MHGVTRDGTGSSSVGGRDDASCQTVMASVQRSVSSSKAGPLSGAWDSTAPYMVNGNLSYCGILHFIRRSERAAQIPSHDGKILFSLERRWDRVPACSHSAQQT